MTYIGYIVKQMYKNHSMKRMILFISLFLIIQELASQSCPNLFQQKNQFCIEFQWTDGEPTELPTLVENIGTGAGSGSLYTEVAGIGSTSGSGDVPFVKYYGTGSSSCNANGYSGSAGTWRITFPSGTIDCSYLSTGVLPVEFSSFTLEEDDGIVLQWTTETEVNNSHFAVERSIDGIVFNTIGHVKAFGNSNHKNRYTFKDPYPLNGTSYYRILQFDFDGKSSSTQVVSYIAHNDQGSFIAMERSSLFLTYEGDFSHSLISMNGQIILQGKNSGPLQIDISMIPTGIYVVDIITESGIRQTKKVTISH